MVDSTLYTKYNSLQKNGADYIINKYIKYMKWKPKDNILDVGCGEGSVTLEVLLQKIPKNFNNLVGIDKSQDMVNLARAKIPRPSIQFEQVDITSTRVPLKFREYFHHIFSFFCLNWVIDQRQALQNMYDMLQPGGDMVILFVITNPVYNAHESMARSNRWNSYMSDYRNYISPYHYSKDPLSDFEGYLSDIGFKCHICEVEDQIYPYSSDSVMTKSLCAVNPFVKRIPKSEANSFIEEYMYEIRRVESVTPEICDDGKNGRVYYPYKMITAYASKPL